MSNLDTKFKETEVLMDEGKYGEAVDAIKETLKIKPTTDTEKLTTKSLKLNLMTCMIHLEEYYKAIDLSREFLESDPNNLMAKYNLGLGYCLSGNSDLGIPQFESIIKIDELGVATEVAKEAMTKFSSKEV